MMMTYKTIVEKIVDGDTVKMNIDLGFRTWIKANCRLYGINTPELNSKDEDERNRAKKAVEYLSEILTVGKTYNIISHELDKYGRPLVTILKNGVEDSINNIMVKSGHAVIYNP
jgi:micrococcal nuclease